MIAEDNVYLSISTMHTNKQETLFNHCREIMVRHINSTMTSMISNVEDALIKMAVKEKANATAAKYIDAVRIMRLKKYEIQVRFKNRYLSLYQYHVRNIIRNNENTDITLSRVGHKSFSKEADKMESKALESTVKKVREDCHAALLSLDNKIGKLMNEIELNNNPLMPETIFEAFWESCRDAEINPEVRLLLISMFEKYVALELKYLYEDLNTYLENQNLD